MDTPCQLVAMHVRAAVLSCLVLTACVSDQVTQRSEAAHGDLAFIGTVTNLEPHVRQGSRHGWLVTFAINEIVAGELEAETFSFLVHSPARSRLELGRRYEVRAIRTAEGYEVDEHQWDR